MNAATGRMSNAVQGPGRGQSTFCHEARFYGGEAGFLDAMLPLIGEAFAAGEPILVMVGATKIERLRRELDRDAGRVHFADMADVGRNPATILPAWREFVDRHTGGGGRVRGIAEPIWPGRTPEELVECHLHESLLNLAFSGLPAWWLVCPYDTTSLDPAVIEEAYRTHPVVSEPGSRRRSPRYAGVPTRGLDTPLPEPGAGVEVERLAFWAGSLSEVRALVAAQAEWAGIDPGRRHGLVVAVNEVATNSVRHGGGRGTLRVWREDSSVVCEVRDRGRIPDLLAGRVRPGESSAGGYGLWLVQHMCDLVQVRSSGKEGVVRLHMRVR